MISIANLSNAQAEHVAQQMLARNRLRLAHEIIRQLEARIAPKAKRRPRKRVAKTGELA